MRAAKAGQDPLRRAEEQATGGSSRWSRMAGGIIQAGGEADVDYIMTHEI